MTDKLEIRIIQLEKIKEVKEDEKDKLIDWMEFLINPESERVKKSMEENGAIREAKEKLDKISEDEKMQQLAWWREKAIYEENTRQNSAYRKGRMQGEKVKQIEIAKKMKENNYEIEQIVMLTGLSKEEIENL